jgi:hypothetical protein
MSAFLRNIKTDDVYKCEEFGVFENLRTGAKGVVDEKTAQANLKINLELTEMCNRFPQVEYFIRVLKLKIEKQ